MVKCCSDLRTFIVIILGIFMITTNILIFEVKQDFNIEQIKNIKPSDIAGQDVYAEQISVNVAGNKSIITNSFLTNDTNFLPYFNTNDPHLDKCNLVISVSNGITPEIFPKVMTGSTMNNIPNTNFNGFSGFLYYDNDLSLEQAQNAANMVLKYIRVNFHMDIIRVNSSDPYFFPFVGYYPNWELYFNSVTANIPRDGYFKAIDLERLTSENYYNNYHLSASIMIINSIEFIDILTKLPTDQVNFNYDPFEIQGFDVNELLDTFNFSISNDISLSDSHLITLEIQYEGHEEGIAEIAPQQYNFNLWKALNYEGTPLRPSEKTFISMISIFLSRLDINILSTEVCDSTPRYFRFDENTLKKIESLFYLLGTDFDIDALKEYSLELVWVGEYGTYASYIRPVNYNTELDPMNVLKNTGFQGISGIPTGVLQAINQFNIIYNISNSEPNLRIRRTLYGENTSHGVDRGEFQFNITVENVGNTTVWGVPYANILPMPLQAIITVASGYNYLLYYEITSFIEDNFDKSLEEFVHFDEEIRVFEIDSFGNGIVDYYYPYNPLTLISSNSEDMKILMPYNEELANLMKNSSDPVFEESEWSLFINDESIRNPDNWKLEPGEWFSYNASTEVSAIDTYSAFYVNNFTFDPPLLPEIINGTPVLGTDASMALELDNHSWIIESVNNTVDVHDFGIDFIFQNDTIIDLVNYSIDRLSIVINFTQNSSILDSLTGLIYNFSLGDYQNMTVTAFNSTRRFTLINFNDSINDVFDPSHLYNFTVHFRLNGTSPEPFNTSINDINIEYEVRDINSVTRLGARILFSPESRVSQLSRRSGSITLGTDEIASIVATAYLTSYNAELGQLNTYTLNLKNIGSLNAENISLSIDIPGIIGEKNYFSLDNNTLTYETQYLNISEELSLNFTFYTPNSGHVSGVNIRYDSPKVHPKSNATSLVTIPNEVFFSAPVNYKNKIPHVRTIEIFYNTSLESPQINDVFNLTVNIKNTSPSFSSIPDLKLSMNDNYGDLVRIDQNRNISISNISYNAIISFNITLYKTDWKAYYYPSINFIRGSENKALQISKSSDIVLGNISLILTKSVNKDQVEIGDQVIVSLRVQNTGTISIKDLDINDMISYSISDFSLKSGSLYNEVTKIDPGETVLFTYIIQAKRQNLVSLKEASIEYFYLNRVNLKSNNVEVKIITPIIRQISYILLPSMLALAIIIIFLRQIKKYRIRKYEMRRHEILLFKSSSRDSIIKVESTLRDRLNILSKKNNHSELEDNYKDNS